VQGVGILGSRPRTYLQVFLTCKRVDMLEGASGRSAYVSTGRDGERIGGSRE
jgi:hypothetical protein